MIALTKGAAPASLVENAKTWTEELLARLGNGEKLSECTKPHYSRPEIKSALLIETHSKCAYCESNFQHVAPGDVEHVIPKSVVPERCYDWENLTIACRVCNTNKGTHQGLVDPFNHDPDDHFYWAGPMVFANMESERGYVTQTLLKLNRLPLVEKRKERLERLHAYALLINSKPQPLRQMLLEDFIKNEIHPSQEYAAMSHAYVYGIPRLNDEQVTA